MPHPRILEATFRTSPAFDLVQFERLSPLEQRTLADLRHDPDGFGVLKPQREGRDLKAVCWRTALLWHSLQSPGPLPRCLLDPDESRANDEVVRLVLDGILELQGAEGFVSGLAAWPQVGRLQGDAAAKGILAELSEDAVRYAGLLRLSDPLALSSRLYDFNRLPASPEAISRVETAARRVGLWSPSLDSGWIAAGNEYWRSWARPGQDGTAPFKLYLSPLPLALIESFSAIVEVLEAAPIRGFKVAADAMSLLRPDKCVVYLPDRETLERLVAALRPITDPLAAHGVPFTAELDRSGVLSWGVDPPKDAARLPWQGPSWRRWITDRLAVTLCANPEGAREPWKFALDRLRLDGIDPVTWTPLAGAEAA